MGIYWAGVIFTREIFNFGLIFPKGGTLGGQAQIFFPFGGEFLEENLLGKIGGVKILGKALGRIPLGTKRVWGKGEYGETLKVGGY